MGNFHRHHVLSTKPVSFLRKLFDLKMQIYINMYMYAEFKKGIVHSTYDIYIAKIKTGLFNPYLMIIYMINMFTNTIINI